MTTRSVSSPKRGDVEIGAVRLPDLGAVIYTNGAPDGLADEIPGLYGCLLSTLDFVVIYERKQLDGCCVLEEPHHVLLLRRDGDEMHVLTRALDYAPEVAERICRAIFRAHPEVRRVRLEVASLASLRRLPWTPVKEVTFMVIDLPSSKDAYYASLGKSTRKTLRGYRNRLERDFPDVRTETVNPDGRGREMVALLAAWKVQRFREKGRSAYWETEPELVERAGDLLEHGGWCRVTYISGKEAAIHVLFRIGDTVFGFEGAHDPTYDDYRLGFLTMYETVCAAIESGATIFNAMAGTAGPKEMLGARRVASTQVTVHRSQLRRRLWIVGGRVSRHRSGAALLRLTRRVRTAAHR